MRYSASRWPLKSYLYHERTVESRVSVLIATISTTYNSTLKVIGQRHVEGWRMNAKKDEERKGYRLASENHPSFNLR